MLFLICFFRHFFIPISVDYQYVTNNQQDFKNRVIAYWFPTQFLFRYIYRMTEVL